MVVFKHSFKYGFSLLVLHLIFLFSSCPLASDENRLSLREAKALKETFKYIESLEPRKLKIEKKTYTRYSNFESIFKFSYSGKKLVNWVQQRIKNYSSGATGDFVAYFHNGEVVLGKQFFTLNKLDRFLVILHEARHADGKEYAHVTCPENFPFLNTRDLKIMPANKKACDEKSDGGYGISASFLFELGAYGLLSTSEAAYRYNSEISRIIGED
jgi:hypothetical protein